ncbi:hypothetical protein NHH03_01145 [Stieleria sp. TO1_6]|uniref:hypothetical protein n=1 Tax=Stieleria tagensis TaxID=2956795 RepID=UPI00209B1BB1|nr:hypothetical protein [Stieleria tagensis]MCO8120323.1 hypothetical protein [Stieleria tagensis]
MNSKNFTTTLVVSLLIAVSGCSSYEPQTATLEQDAYARVEGLGDLASDEKMFASAFVPGAEPKNRKDYSARGYQVTGQPSIEGDSASVTVKIFGGVVDSAAGDGHSRASTGIKDSQQTWTLQLVDDNWKIKDAPLG